MGSATTEQVLRCLTSADEHVGVGGYGNAPTKRGGNDGKDKGSDNRPRRQERPIAAAARGMGRGGVMLYTVPKVLIGVSIRQSLIGSW
eukprot:scaffold703_cov56-Phaeocystis_antarctica.AAC.2